MKAVLSSKEAIRRLRYIAVATALALLVSFPNLLNPLDLVQWTLQAKIGHEPVSGEIVFVDTPETILESAEERAELREAVVKLEQAGARAIFLDLARQERSATQPDEALRTAIESSDIVYSVGRTFTDRNRDRVVFPPSSIVGDAGRVVAVENRGLFDYVWREPATVMIDEVKYDTLARRLAPVHVNSDASIDINYHFDAGDIPALSPEDLDGALTVEGFANGKAFVFGYPPSATNTGVDLPASPRVPQSYVGIFAAETASRGGLTHIGAVGFDYVPLLMLLVCILLATVLLEQNARRMGYAIAVTVASLAVILPIFFAYRTGSAGGIFFLCSYGLLCLIHRWRVAVGLKSQVTGLPTIQMLEKDLTNLPISTRKVLVSAKIHHVSDVMAALPGALKSEYFQGIAKRLRIGDTNLQVYSNGSDRLFWLQEFETQDAIRAHLLALLAIFKNPLILNGKAIDIAITFGADFNFTVEGQRRVSLAEALTDRTSLSTKPIIFGENIDETDEEWRLSLQSKIDAALDAGEIYPVFQPQADILLGEIVGFEGLLRWKDNERGFISPSYFIEQCERAGRMEKLQKYMLRACIHKFQRSKWIESKALLSVNVSATLLTDTWLTEVVSGVLEETEFPANRLVLEITETARIEDHQTANAILSVLASIGVHLSLDDFGTGTAGLENFYRLPFSELKVDQLFTAAIVDDPKARAIVKSAIDLGHALNVRVIVEGVETEETSEVLREMGCRFTQGYLIGRPERDIEVFGKSANIGLRSA